MAGYASGLGIPVTPPGDRIRSRAGAVYRKLGVSSRREAVASARARGIITR